MNRIVLSPIQGPPSAELSPFSCRAEHIGWSCYQTQVRLLTTLKPVLERQALIESKGCFIQEASSLGESILVSKKLFQRFCLAMQVAPVVKNLPANARNSRDTSLISGSGRLPEGEKWQPPPVFLPEKPRGQRSLVGCSLWGLKESEIAEHKDVQVFIGKRGKLVAVNRLGRGSEPSSSFTVQISWLVMFL